VAHRAGRARAGRALSTSRTPDRESIIRLAFLASAIALTLVGCGGGDGDGAVGDDGRADDGRAGDDAAPSWRAITDTIGDTVVVRTVGVTDEAAALRLVEELRIGELEGADEYQFADVDFVLPASGGGVYVWDRIVGALRQYDAAGRFVRRIGGFGRGPGEYRAANGLVQLRDGRLVLWDPENVRMNVYDSAGTVAGSWRYESTLGIQDPRGLLVDSADNVYAIHWFRPTDGPGQALPAEHEGYRVLGPDGVLRDSVLPPRWLPSSTVIAARGSEGGAIRSLVPFAPQPLWTVSRFGYVVSGVGDRYAITLHRPGAPLRIERDVEPVPIESDERVDAEEIAMAEMRQVDRSWRWSGPSIPDVKPFLTGMRAAADGRIWVRRAVRGVPAEPDAAPQPGLAPPIGAEGPPVRIPPPRWREPVMFDVFAADGRFLGALAVPERVEVLHMRGDEVWGVERDELDVPQVVRWRISPSLAARERSR
jgi:hypothetical protein